MSNAEPLGCCEAIVTSIKTRLDGSFAITFEINPSDQQLVSRLIERYALNERLVTLGMAVKVE